jgi:hypothetical protein
VPNQETSQTPTLQSLAPVSPKIIKATPVKASETLAIATTPGTTVAETMIGWQSFYNSVPDCQFHVPLIDLLCLRHPDAFDDSETC